MEYDGNAVLDGKTIVIDEKGHDVTKNYVDGAQKVLETTLSKNIEKIYLNQYSPSCGHGKTLCGYLGYKKYISGDGVTTALLRRNGIKVMTKIELTDLYEKETKNKGHAQSSLLDYR